MGDRQSHLEKAEHNLKYIETFELNKTIYLDWAVTAIFYTALHYIDAYLAFEGFTRINNHEERFNLVKKHLQFLYDDYDLLFHNGIKARYYTNFEFDPYKVKLLRDITLSKIKKEIGKLLKQTL